jgi:hypothetical protein
MSEPTFPTADDGRPPTTWVSVAEAAEKSGVGTSTVRQWYRSGRIPTQRAEGERGAFLVPLDAVLALAEQADDEGDDLGAALIDLNASYWSDQTEIAREEATAARNELAATRTELAAAAGEVEAARDQLSFLRSQLAELSEDNRQLRLQLDEATKERDRLRDERAGHLGEAARLRLDLEATTDELGDARSRLTTLEGELSRLRTITSATASITDNSWLELPTNTYRSPVRPQGMTGDALASLVADTQPDDDRGFLPTSFDDDLTAPVFEPGPGAGDAVDAAGEVDDEVDDDAPAPRRVEQRDFGHHADDLLPEQEKKGRRSRR